MQKNMAKGMELTQNEITTYKARIMSEFMFRLRDCNLRYAVSTELADVLTEAKELSAAKYANDRWVFRTDVRLRNDVRFCILFEGAEAKPTDVFRPLLDVSGKDVFDGAEIVSLGYNTGYDAALNLAHVEVMRKRSSAAGKFYIVFFTFKRPAIIMAEYDSADAIKDRNLEGVEITRSDGGGRPMIVSENGLGYCVTGPLYGPTAGKFDNVIKIHNSVASLMGQSLKAVIGGSYEFGLGKTGSSIRINGRPIAGHSARIRSADDAGNPVNSFSYAGYIEVRSEDPNLIRSAINVTEKDMDDISKLPTVMGLAKE